MELVYIYFKEYKALKNTNINFNKKLEFSFDDIGIKLDLRKNSKKDILGPMFFGENITNVTAILGKNGSGKSTILDFICRKLTSINTDFIKIFRGKNQVFYIYSNIAELNVTSISHKAYIPVIDNGINTIAEIPHDFNYVYYSSYFDGNNMQPITRQEDLINENPKLFDISTSYLVKKHERLSERSIEQYNQNEFNKLLHLITSGNRLKKNKIHYPEYLFIAPDLALLDHMVNKGKSFNQVKIKQAVIYLHERIKDLKKDSLDILYLSFLIALFIKLDDEIEDNSENLKSWLKIENTLNEGYSDILQVLINEGYLNKFSFIKEIKESASTFIALLEDVNGMLAFETKSSSFPIDDVEKLVLYLSYYRFDRFYPFQFIWSFSQQRIPAQFSSGERIMLSLYSRLFDLKVRELSDNYLIILLDEPDIGLHPQWQKMFFDEFLNFLGSHFRDASIQLIITSHSPFIASDLPYENVIYLGQSNSKNSPKKTFAANIHELLADSFFMQNGFIGEFATGKIEDVIDHLLFNKDEPGTHDPLANKKDTKEYCKALINIVGEPLVSDQLLMMYLKKYPSEEIQKINRLEQIIIEKDKEIEQLKSKGDV